MDDSKLNKAILEAISIIVTNTTKEVSFKVEHSVDKQPFKKQGIKKTFILIELSEIV